MESLNFIGCGNVGRTLGRLFHKKGVFRIGDILTRSLDSAEAAVEFIGAGRPVAGLREMKGAGVTLICTPDSVIGNMSQQLSESDLVFAGCVVCHCSGALPSSILGAVKSRGGHCASIHPVKSFSNPGSSTATFTGTLCDAEGDAAARESLCRAFEAIGARTLVIAPESKTLYHAASAVASNYLTALMETCLQLFQSAGLSRERALDAALPLAKGTIENISQYDTFRALTGPIARGDSEIVKVHMEALAAKRPEYMALYRQLGKITLELAEKKGSAAPESLRIIARLLQEG